MLRRKITKIFPFLFLLLLVTSCQAQKITSVSYRHTAGRGGYENITATSDFLVSNVVGRFDLPNVSRQTKSKEWKKLISLINIKQLENSENGETRGQYDGPDDFFTISTANKKYEFVNVKDSAVAGQLQLIKEQLRNMVKSKE